jgi:competence ComEA-like helix-hairpin-helix protein
MKPNYKTSEFWFTLVSFIISGFFLLGIITDNDYKDELIDTITHAVESCILISGQSVVLYRYMTSRKEQKVEYEKTRRQERDHLEEELEDYVGIDDEIININTANAGELIKLPHIGPATAKKILDYRNKNGKFLHAKELIRIPGVGKSTFQEIKEYITL